MPALVKLPGPLVTQTFASWNLDNVASYVKRLEVRKPLENAPP